MQDNIITNQSSIKVKHKSKLELFFIGFFVLSVLFTFLLTFVLFKYGTNLPDYNQLAEYRPPVTSRFYSSDGTLLTEYATEQRIFVPLKDIPPNLINAFIAAEDKKFWSHHGIDPIGIIRATIVNVKNKILGNKRGAIGASTITQQVAKNFFLTSEKSISRKLKEVILALKMERAFSKRHILTLYFNQIFLGFRSYGVAAAALNYFNKSLNELTIAECAFLAALPKAPNNYNPITNKERAIDRRNWVLERMQDDGYITKEESEFAQTEDIVLSESFVSKNQRYSLYFSEEVRKFLSDIYGEEQLYAGGLSVMTTLIPEYQKIVTDSLRKALINFDLSKGWRGAEKNIDIDSDEWVSDKKIINTLKNTNKQLWEILLDKTKLYSGAEDNGWEKAIVLNVDNNEAKIGLKNGRTGLITLKSIGWNKYIKQIDTENTIDDKSKKEITKTFKITFMTEVLKKGDIIFVKKTYDGETYSLQQVPELNGAIILMNPHTGQIYAMVGGFSYTRSKFNRATQAYRQPGSTIKPFVYLTALENGYNPSSILLDAPVVLEKTDGSLWRPENYDNTFTGEITLRRALEQSKNNPTIRVAKDVGIRKFLKNAQKFGIYKNIKEANLAMTLGSGDTTLIDLTSGFAKLVNGGKNITPTLIDRVQDRNGKSIYKSDGRECKLCNTKWENNIEVPELNDEKETISDTASLYQIINILQGVVERGSGWKAKIENKTIFGKTGTSNDQKDVWFIGGTPDLVAGVFLGYDNPHSLGDYAAGGSLAAPVFKDFMSIILKNKKNIAFRQPKGIDIIRVNRETGRPASQNDKLYNTVLEAFKTGTNPFSSNNGIDSIHSGKIDNIEENNNFDGIY